MQINDKMIQAACAATVLGEGEDGKPVHLDPREARIALEAALSTLPIAGEGKVSTARAEAADEILGLLTGHELYKYRPKAFQGFIDYVRENFSTASLTGKVTAPINWEDANDPAVKLFVGYDVEGYVEEYELCGDDGDYTPNESEKTLIADAIYGVVFDIHEKLRALIPSSPGKDGGQVVEEPCPTCGNEERGQGGYLSCECPAPRPASTALVERLTKALEPFSRIAGIFDYPGGNRPTKDSDPIAGWSDHRVNNGEDILMTVGDLRRARSALSASTSREGER